MDKILQVQCPVCELWCVQDHMDADELHPAWTTHILREHPYSNIAHMLDSLMLESILGG